eukprot:jgi/Botrbrau1/17396/Bobra.0911s0003.1
MDLWFAGPSQGLNKGGCRGPPCPRGHKQRHFHKLFLLLLHFWLQAEVPVCSRDSQSTTDGWGGWRKMGWEGRGEERRVGMGRSG